MSFPHRLGRSLATSAPLLLGLALLAQCNINPIPTPGGDTTGGSGGGGGVTRDAAAGVDIVGLPDTGGSAEDTAAPPADAAPGDAVAPADVPADVPADTPGDVPADSATDTPTDALADAEPVADTLDDDATAVMCDEAVDCPPDAVAFENPCVAVDCVDGACVTVPVEGPCEDGLFCTVDDVCAEGRCVGGAARDCSDGEHDPEDGYCDEENDACYCCDPDAVPCTTDGQGCETNADCDDGDPCTRNACLTFRTPAVCACTADPACAAD